MEYRILKYFLAVAREENITRASEVLHISQPALSRQLMQLEEELGTQLLIRGKRAVTLTDAGLLLKRRAQEIIDLTEKTEQEFKDDGSSVSGIITIGSGETAASRAIPELMKGFGEKYLNVRFELYSNNADHLKEHLERGLLDVAILLEPVDLSKYDYIRLPYKDRFGAVVPSKCPLFQKEYVTADDLQGRRLFAGKRSSLKGELAAWFGDEFDKLNIYATHNLVYNTALLVEDGMGAAITLEGAVSLYHNPNFAFKPFKPELSLTSVLVWKKHQPLSPSVSKFIDFAKMQFDYDKR